MGSRQLGELLMRPPPFRTLAVSQSSRPAWRRTTLCLSPSQRSVSSNSKPGPLPTATQEKQQDGPKEEAQSSRDELNKGFGDLFASNSRNTQSSTSTIDALWSSSGVDPKASSSAYAAAAQLGIKPRPYGSTFQPRSGGMGIRPQRTNWDDQTLPDTYDNLPMPNYPDVPEKEPVYPRLNASYGRQVQLDPKRGRDLVRGLGMLASMMARNQVKRDFAKQKFHERPGLKRKRLKSERWRARFKKEFDNTCKRVTELTRKGW